MASTALVGVWLAGAENVALVELLTALGAPPVRRDVDVPEPTTAWVSALENGDVVLLPKSRRLIPDRPIIGAVLATRAGDAAPHFVPPDRAHGVWLEFRRAW